LYAGRGDEHKTPVTITVALTGAKPERTVPGTLTRVDGREPAPFGELP